MRPIVQAALRSLQGLAHARAADQCKRVAWLSRVRARSADMEERPSGVAAWETRIATLRLGMSADDLVELKIKRAIFLRMLLDSAPARLQAWVDEDILPDMPASHLFEWVCYDLERLELDEIEATLTPREEARYVREASEFRGFD
jgi:hypothetical protein